MATAEALCALAEGGSAEELRRALDGAEGAKELLRTRCRRGKHRGLLPIHVAARHNPSVAVTRLLIESGVDQSGLLLAIHIAEKKNAAVLKPLVEEEEYRAGVRARPAKPEEDAHEGLTKKDFRTFSKLYRDPKPFAVVENEVLWELGKCALQRPEEEERVIECWSVGCSAGEEAYSLLVSWEQALSQHLEGVSLRVLGTDLSDAALDAARRAEFSTFAMTEVPKAWRQRCFAKARLEDGQRCYRVEERLRRQFTCVRQDVREELPQGRFDLVVCRYSVFLYCSRDESEAFLRSLVSGCLRPGGFLFVGAQDTLPQVWRSLGLREWRGHKGLYRLGEDPLRLEPGDERYLSESLADYLGGPARERAGSPGSRNNI